MKKVINRDEVKEINDIKKEWVDIPEWNNSPEDEVGVFIQSMMANERDQWEYDNFVKGNEGTITKGKNKVVENTSKAMKRIRVSLVILCAVDEEGKKVFTSQDAEWLGTKNAKAVDRMYEVAQRINGMRREDVEDEVKNSLEGQTESSPSN